MGRHCLLYWLLTVQVGSPTKEKVRQGGTGHHSASPCAAQPHPNGTMPCRSPAPQARCSAAVLLVDRGSQVMHLPVLPTSLNQGPEKGSVVPFLLEHLPRKRQSVPPSCSPRPQLAHGPGEGGKGEGRTNPNQLKTEPGIRRLGSTNQLVALWICSQRVGFRFSNTREEPVTMPWR